METEEQLKRDKYSTAESFASLSLGLWTVALAGYATSGFTWPAGLLFFIGVVSVIFSIYLVLPWNQIHSIKYLEAHHVIRILKLIGWFIVLFMFGVSLVLTGEIGIAVVGIVFGIIAFIVLFIGLLRLSNDI